jgi:fructose-specific phosphotransferase system IIC component
MNMGSTSNVLNANGTRQDFIKQKTSMKTIKSIFLKTGLGIVVIATWAFITVMLGYITNNLLHWSTSSNDNFAVGLGIEIVLLFCLLVGKIVISILSDDYY